MEPSDKSDPGQTEQENQRKAELALQKILSHPYLQEPYLKLGQQQNE